MEIFLEKQLINIAYSLILGLIFGIIYDIIRIMYILCGIMSYSGEKRGMVRGRIPFLIFFVFDLLYMITVTVLYSLFNYARNNGSFRVFILAATVCGFVLYYFTVGRVVMFVSDAVVRFLRLAFKYTVAIPLGFVLGILSRILRFIYKNTVGRAISAVLTCLADRRTELFRRSLPRDIKFDIKEGGAK